jgi:hypothetical protein
MADNKIYVSPGVFTSEKDLTFVSQQVGVTTLGIVGETVKGPAFEPIFVTNYEEYSTIFGGLNSRIFKNGKPQYEASYIAKQYLKESNQLFVTRILGLTGYDAGQAWAIVADASYDPTTITTAATDTFTAQFSGSSTNLTFFDFSPGLGGSEAFELIDLYDGINVNPYTGVGTPFDLPGGGQVAWSKVGGSFTGSSLIGEVTSQNSLALTGTVSGTVYTFVASAYTQYENKVIAMIRSRADIIADNLFWRTDQSINGLLGDFSLTEFDPLGNFVLSAASSGLTNVITYDVSLDSTKRNYLPRDTRIWVEEIYPNMLTDLISNGQILGLKPQLLHFNTFNNYQQQWQTPETPWVVSELRGNKVEKLFKFISISDGSEANREIKISIQRINLEDKTFDVVIRQFNDLDSRPQILESFSKCSLDPTDRSFIGERIGTADGEYVLKSRYIMMVLNPEAPIDAFPAGFEGYRVRDYVSSTSVVAKAPELEYKSSYDLINSLY